MKKIYIIDGKRTAIGSFLGSLSNTHPKELGKVVLENILTTNNINVNDIGTVIIGNVLSAGLGQGIARQISILSGIPTYVPAYSINMLCGSGMKSVINLYKDILIGEVNIGVAGGVENMSMSPFLIPAKIRKGHKMMDITIKDHMIIDGLTDAFEDIHMGITAENIADKYDISRKEQDIFAYNSQRKTIKAIKEGKFKDEIVPFIINEDEYPNKESDKEKLSKLRTVFKKDGTVTAGNSSGINDGASMLLLASEEYIKENNIMPMVEIVAVSEAGVEPSIMGMGPVPAIDKALEKAKISLKDIDLIELNEAFSAQSLGVIHELKEKYNVNDEWLEDRLNVNGGAISLGHPIGASGNRIIVTLIHEMKRRKVKYGLASLCIGGGMGTAIILKYNF